MEGDVRALIEFLSMCRGFLWRKNGVFICACNFLSSLDDVAPVFCVITEVYNMVERSVQNYGLYWQGKASWTWTCLSMILESSINSLVLPPTLLLRVWVYCGGAIYHELLSIFVWWVGCPIWVLFFCLLYVWNSLLCVRKGFTNKTYNYRRPADAKDVILKR